MVRGRLGFGVIALAAASVAAAVPAASAQEPPATGGGNCKPTATIVTDSQTEILQDKTIRVVVDQGECELGERIRVNAKDRVKGKRREVAKPARTELAGARTEELKLNKKGEKRVKRCDRQTLIVKVNGNGFKAQDREKVKRDRVACGGDGGSGGGGGGGGGNSPSRFEPAGINTLDAGRCDFLDPFVCLQPFPNDHFTAPAADPAADQAAGYTGRRINFNPLSMPRNRAQVPINPLDFNQNDGFSPGNMIMTKVPGLETQKAFDATGAVPITDIGRYADPNQPIVVIDAETGERQPIWAEVDANPISSPDDEQTNPSDGEPAPEDVNLLIRPATNFKEGHRYIVALRNLKDEKGKEIPVGRGFELYRDDIRTPDNAVEARRSHYEQLFKRLTASGIERKSLYLAWDFTVASERNLSERALSIRDDAFAQLGDENLSDLQVQGCSPTFSVELDDQLHPGRGRPHRPPGRRERSPVPCYTNLPSCPPGSSFAFAPGSNVPQGIPGNTMDAELHLQHPALGDRRRPSAGEAGPLRPRPARRRRARLNSGPQEAMASEHGYIYCATDWAGFATTDIATVAASLQDLSNFSKLVDRMQQGFVNFMYLGRALIHPQGLGTNAAFQAGGQSVIDRSRLFYDGNSQGGIMGGALTALSPDLDRAVLGVPGMNYSSLLRRSVDFDLYARGDLAGEGCGLIEGGLPDQFDPLDPILGPALEFCRLTPTPVGLYDNYPNQLERPLILSLMQMLWDRGEANGYAHHLTTDPLADTPPHEVLLHPAFGDHQVATLTAEVEARTIGAVTNANPLDAGRIPGTDPLWGIPRVDLSNPHAGSAIVYWDSGSPAPPTQNLPPREGRDPHGHPRNDVKARRQKAAFLKIGGVVTEQCGGGPCYADGYTGAP